MCFVKTVILDLSVLHGLMVLASLVLWPFFRPCCELFMIVQDHETATTLMNAEDSLEICAALPISSK